MSSESRGFSYLLVVWFVLTSYLVLGFVAVGASSASGDPFTLVNVTVPGSAPPVAGPTVAAPVLPAAAEQYPSLVYGGVTWSILESRLVSGSVTESNRPIVVVEAVVVNTTTDVTLRVRDSDVALVWPGGRREQVTRFEQLSGATSFSLDPGQPRDLTLVFKPQVNIDPDLAVLALEIAEPGRIPGHLPLLGPADPVPYPQSATIEQTVAAESRLGRMPSLMASPLRAVLDINAGPYRAANGQRLVLVDLAIRRPDGAAEPTSPADHLAREYWRLTIDGRTIAPSRVVQSDGSAVDRETVSLLFVVAAETTDAALVVGAGTEHRAEYTLRFLDH
ncbi:MAG: hypothetical protein AAF531_19475 [Actinomycetota bacterium]